MQLSAKLLDIIDAGLYKKLSAQGGKK